MELSGKIDKNKKRQYFLTQVTNEDVRVRFEDDELTSRTPLHIYESVPIPNQIPSKSDVKSEGRRHKKFGLNKLKSLLKSSKQTEGRSGQQELSQRRQQTKYHRISIKQDSKQQSKVDSQRMNWGKSMKFKSSINMFLQRTQTENVKADSNVNLEAAEVRRVQKRKQCRITTQQQFQEECTKFIEQKQKEETQELFRQMNRKMKLSLKAKDPNEYYQTIRKSALRKLDYMSENQKYYNQHQVTHLFTVVQNCNLLIHKRTPIFRTKRQTNIQAKCKISAQFFKERPQKEQKDATDSLNRTSISRERLLLDTEVEIADQPVKVKSSKVIKLSAKEKVKMNKKASDIVNVCSQERKMLQEVKNGMKIFQYYCSEIDSGFANKGRRLNNFLTGDEEEN